MIKFFIDLLQFLHTTAPLLTSLAIFTLLAVLLSGSIKKHASIYYTVLAIPFVMGLIPYVGQLFGLEIPSFARIPFLGGIIRDYIHFGTFAFPILIIVMYIGALNPRILWVKKLLKIRKELSIISGFPVLTHALIRVTHTFPRALSFFTDNEEYLANSTVYNEVGAGISNFSFVLGILLLILFLPLWITSFTSIHKRMGNKKWKKLQKWSYPFYALLFIHAMGIQIGGLLNSPDDTRQQTQMVALTPSQHSNRSASTDTTNTALQKRESTEQQGKALASGQSRVSNSERGGRPRSIGFADINVSREVRRYIHISSLILIFGSYLYLRMRKARRDSARRRNNTL